MVFFCKDKRYLFSVIGLTDTSPEELRLEAYKCKDSGNMQPYVRLTVLFSTNCLFDLFSDDVKCR